MPQLINKVSALPQFFGPEKSVVVLYLSRRRGSSSNLSENGRDMESTRFHNLFLLTRSELARKWTKSWNAYGTTWLTSALNLSSAFYSHNYGEEDNYFYFLFCDWRTSWSLLYRPIDENEGIKIDEIIEVLKYVFDNY